MLPSSGLSYTVRAAKIWRPSEQRYTPLRRLRSVLFPAPLGPITARISPALTERSSPLNALKPLNRSESKLLSRMVPILCLPFRAKRFLIVWYQTLRTKSHHEDHQKAVKKHPPLLNESEHLRENGKYCRSNRRTLKGNHCEAV